MVHFKEFLQPAITETAHDPNWRVRETLLGLLPRLAQFLKNTDVAEMRLCELYMQGLSDPVWTIRTATAGAIDQLVETVGIEWLSTVIIPHLEELRQNKNYIFRSNVMTCIASCLKAVSHLSTPHALSRQLATKLFDLAFELSKDPVANIRITVARTLLSCGHRIVSADKQLYMCFYDCLRHLTDDADEDVRFFAEQAMAQLPQHEQQAPLQQPQIEPVC
eukprot:Selendium_serpulae@DN4481_c0_g1_i2.p1